MDFLAECEKHISHLQRLLDNAHDPQEERILRLELKGQQRYRIKLLLAEQYADVE